MCREHCSSIERFGPDPQITIPASGFTKMPQLQALQKTALDHMFIGSETTCITGGNHRRHIHLGARRRPADLARQMPV